MFCQKINPEQFMFGLFPGDENSSRCQFWACEKGKPFICVIFTTVCLDAAKDPLADAMAEMMNRIKSGNLQLKPVRSVRYAFL